MYKIRNVMLLRKIFSVAIGTEGTQKNDNVAEVKHYSF